MEKRHSNISRTSSHDRKNSTHNSSRHLLDQSLANSSLSIIDVANLSGSTYAGHHVTQTKNNNISRQQFHQNQSSHYRNHQIQNNNNNNQTRTLANNNASSAIINFSKTLEQARSDQTGNNNNNNFDSNLPPASPKNPQTIRNNNNENHNLTAQEEEFLTDDSLVQKMMDRDDSIIRQQHKINNPNEGNNNNGVATTSSEPFYSENSEFSYNETLDSFANQAIQGLESEAENAILEQQNKMDEIENHLHKRCNDQGNISLGMTADEETITDQYQNSSFQVMEDTPIMLMNDDVKIPNPINQKSDRSLMNAKLGDDNFCLDETENNEVINSRYFKTNNQTQNEISNLATNLTKMNLSQVGNVQHVDKFHKNLRRSLDPTSNSTDNNNPLSQSFDESVHTSSPEYKSEKGGGQQGVLLQKSSVFQKSLNASNIHEKTTALINPNFQDTYHNESTLDYSINETLPMEMNDSTNLDLNPVVKVGNGIDSLTFITTTPIGSSAQANINLENTWNEEVDLHLLFGNERSYDPLFPFSIANSTSLKITLSPLETKSIIIEFKPSEPGNFSTVLRIHELTTENTHNINFFAKSGKAHIEMDMSAVQLDMKPPGFLEPTIENFGNNLNGTMVLDPVTYLGELDFSLKFDLDIVLKNVGTCNIKNAEILLKQDPDNKFMELKSENNSISSLEPGFSQNFKLRVKFTRLRDGKSYACKPGYHSVDLLIIKNSEQLFCHKFTAKVGQTKVKIPKQMHKIQFFKDDVKTITGIRNHGDVTVNLQVKPVDESEWIVEPKQLLLEPNMVGQVQVSYRCRNGIVQNGIITTSRLRFVAQPNGYAASVILEAIPEQFQKVPSPIKEDVFSKKNKMILQKPPLKSSLKKTSTTNSCLLGNHSWLIYDSSITGGYVKQSVNVQNPKLDTINLKIDLTGENSENFDIKISQKMNNLLGGRELNIPVYYRPKTNGLHLSNLQIRSQSFNGNKFIVPLIGWTCDGMNEVLYDVKNNIVLNRDRQNDYLIVSIFNSGDKSNIMFDFELRKLGRIRKLELSHNPLFIISLNGLLRDLALASYKNGFPDPGSKLERTIFKRLPSEFFRFGGFSDDFLRQLLSSIYNDSMDRQQAIKQPSIQKILNFSSITPPGQYILEKSVNNMHVLYNGTSENKIASSPKNSNRVPFKDVAESKIHHNSSNNNHNNIPVNNIIKQKQRLSQQSSTPNRSGKLPKQNTFKNENSY